MSYGKSPRNMSRWSLVTQNSSGIPVICSDRASGSGETALFRTFRLLLCLSEHVYTMTATRSS